VAQDLAGAGVDRPRRLVVGDAEDAVFDPDAVGGEGGMCVEGSLTRLGQADPGGLAAGRVGVVVQCALDLRAVEQDRT